MALEAPIEGGECGGTVRADEVIERGHKLGGIGDENREENRGNERTDFVYECSEGGDDSMDTRRQTHRNRWIDRTIKEE